MIRKLLMLLALVGWSNAAHAEWREAESRNFLVYSEASEAELRAFAEKLEKFDFVLRRIHKVQAPPSPNKLKIVLVPNQRAVATLAGYPQGGIAGYYVRDARAMMMVGSRNRVQRPGGGDRGENREVRNIDPEYVLLHEYTHHFMYQYFPATYPTWYSEGFAEFWGATRFGENGVIEVGRPAEHRFGSFVDNRWLSMNDLLEAQNYSQVDAVDLLYAQGWLLVRYSWENPERQKQLQQYLALINRGTPYAQAAKTAFGDVGKLNAELRQYSRRARYNVIQLPFKTIDIGEIKVRTLSPAEQAMFLTEIEWAQGVSNREFPAFAARVRREAAAHPNDPFALRLLAEVERVANNLPAARAAVEKLLTVKTNDPRGLMLKGLIELDALKAGGSAAAFAAARRPIEQAARLAPNDPLVQEAIYTSYARMGSLPPEDAQAALYRAMELAPSDDRLRYLVASDFEKRGMIPEAIATIRPDAYRVPDRRDESEGEKARRERQEERNRRAGTAKTETAREMLERLLKKQQGSGGGS
jgi:tetratricopeptide (TPR) repeat protein